MDKTKKAAFFSGILLIVLFACTATLVAGFEWVKILRLRSPTVAIFSAASSGIEIPNSSSISIISSTLSNESALKSFVKLASEVTSDSETPNFSTIIAFTLDSISDIVVNF